MKSVRFTSHADEKFGILLRMDAWSLKLMFWRP
jgi:hypothetical protein